MSVVTLGIEYFADPDKGAPVANGFVYVGEPGTDPTKLINQKDVSLLQENGTLVPTAQPVELGAGGVAMYQGSPVQIITSDVYSIAVHDKNDAQVYYQPNNSSATETGAGVYADLRATTGTADGNTVMVAGKTTIGDGYGGQFFWDSSDFSTEVTNDPLEKKYVPPTVDLTGASGSWVRSDGLSYISYADLRLQVGLFDGQNITISYRSTLNDGGGGIFSWNAANVSTEVTGDTQSGVYVSPTADLTGANGAWVRQYDGSVDVKWFGAIGDGVADDTTAFQVTVDSIIGVDYQINKSTVLKAPVKTINIDGNYNLVSAITSSDKIVWILSAQTTIDATKLTGQVFIDGVHVNAIHTGILENATTLSLRGGRELNAVGGVYGITTEDSISRVGPPHSVTLQVDNATDIIPLTLTGTTYTPTSVMYTNTLDLTDVKIGATITSLGSPTQTAIITAVNQGTKTITVGGGWRPFTGVDAATGTPTDGDSAAVDYFSKIWGQNTNTILSSGHPTTKMAGYELGVLNHQQDAPPYDPTVTQDPTVWGFDAINLGTFKGGVGHISRAGATAWRTGFASYGNEYGFETIEKTGLPNTTSFQATADNGQFLKFKRVNGSLSFAVQNNGSLETGRQDVTQDTVIDMHSSGNVNDYDVRLRATGGTATLGEGTLTVLAADTVVPKLTITEGGPTISTGTGTPEGVVTAPIGSMYTDKAGGAGTTLYIKESGISNTGWVAK